MIEWQVNGEQTRTNIHAPSGIRTPGLNRQHYTLKFQLGLCWLKTRFLSRQGQMIFPLASVSRPALGPTQPPVQWVPGVLSPGLKCGRGVTLTTHPHLVSRSRISRSYIFSTLVTFIALVGQLSFFYVFIICEISSSHGGEYDVQSCLLGYTAV
jgi:hypothetical protein